MKSRKGIIGVEGGKGSCYQWKEEGQCSQGRPVQFPPSILRQPCRYYLKGTCTRTPCEYWHRPSANFIKQKRVVSLETRVCFLITRLTNNKIKNRKRATSQKNKREQRQECCGHCEKCTTIGLRLARLGCVGFSKRQTVSEKPDAEKS